MDLEEWEFLSEEGFIDQLHRQGRNGRRAIPTESLSLQPNSAIDMNHFHQFSDPKGVSVSPNLVIPVPVEFDLPAPNESAIKDSIPFQVFGSEPDPETVSSQVFFKKMKGNEFADMKLDSPKSTIRGFGPQLDLGKPQFEEKEDLGTKSDEGLFDFDENYTNPDQKERGLSIWKKGMTGIGALCTFGFACAAVCVIALGSRHRESKQQDQKLHFHVCADDKRMKQVGMVNEAISAIRGGRPHVTLGL